MLRSVFVAGLTVVLGAGLLAGCGGGAPQDDRPVVAATLLTATHVFFQDLTDAMEAEAEARGLRLRVQYAEFDLRRQNNQIDTFIAQRPAALIVAPADSSGIAPALRAATDAGIPVFTVDIAADDAPVVSHIASDNYTGGQKAARYLAEAIGGAGQLAIIDHPEVRSVQDRTRGFLEVLEEFPGIELVARVPGEGQRDKSLRAAEDILYANPELDGIFAINDDTALGALAAVQAAGRADAVVIVGFDGTPEAREAIAQGTALKADVVQYPERVGAETIRVVHAHLQGETVPDAVPVEVGVIDQESLAAE